MKNQVNPYEVKTVAEVLSELKVKPQKGLTDDEVKERQQRDGLNEVPGGKTIDGDIVLTSLLGAYRHHAGNNYSGIVCARQIH